MRACFIISGVLFLMGGCSLAGSVVTRERLAQVPRMTCAQLAQKGLPADGQVTLTDVRPCSRGYVATRFEHSLDLYIPAYPAGLAEEPALPELRFLLQVWSDHDWEKLTQPGPAEVTCWANRAAHVVEVSRGPGEIEPWVRDGLRKKYPGIQLGNLCVLTFGHGNTPTPERAESAWRSGIGELLLGAAVLLVGIVLAWRRRGAPAALGDSGSSASEDDQDGVHG